MKALVLCKMAFAMSIACVLMTAGALAQERVARPEAKPLPPPCEAWANMPETFRRGLKLPDWPRPTDLRRWERRERAATRQKILSLLGELPPRPDPARVRV